MKILFDTYNSAYHAVSGGVQIKISECYKQLEKNGFNITLFNKWEDNISSFDIVHIFKPNIDSLSLFLLAKKEGIPVVASSIVSLENKTKIHIGNVLEKFNINMIANVTGKMLRESNYIIAETEKEKNFIINNYKVERKNISVIPNGITIDLNKDYLNLFQKSTGINGKYVLQVGRFDTNKNQLNTILALNDTNINVVFIGGKSSDDPGYYDKCRKIAKKNIHFLGWVEHSDPLLASAYMNAQVVILPSFKEIYGNALLEGGAAGANLIATAELPIYEWGLQDYCTTIDPSNVEDIKSKVIYAMDRKKDGIIASLINEKFSWENIVKEYSNIYKKVSNKQKTD